jgi:BON domain
VREGGRHARGPTERRPRGAAFADTEFTTFFEAGEWGERHSSSYRGSASTGSGAADSRSSSGPAGWGGSTGSILAEHPDEPQVGWDARKGGPYAGRGPKGYRRSDERIHEDVCDCLTQHGRIDASNMTITVWNGEVTITGSVQDRRVKRLAEEVAEAVAGVSQVHNQLRVVPRDDRRSETL